LIKRRHVLLKPGNFKEECFNPAAVFLLITFTWDLSPENLQNSREAVNITQI
jgi:hypothetical protein